MRKQDLLPSRTPWSRRTVPVEGKLWRIAAVKRDLQLKMHHHRLRTRRRKRTSSGCHLSQSPKRRRAKRAPSRYPMMPVSDLHPSTLFILRFRAVVHSGWKLRQQTLANWTFCLLVMQTVSYTGIYTYEHREILLYTFEILWKQLQIYISSCTAEKTTCKSNIYPCKIHRLFDFLARYPYILI